MEHWQHRTLSLALRVVLLSGFLLLAWLVLAHPAFADDAPAASPTPSSSPTGGAGPTPTGPDPTSTASPAPTDPAGSASPPTATGTTTADPTNGSTPPAAPAPDPAPTTEPASPSPTDAESATPAAPPVVAPPVGDGGTPPAADAPAVPAAQAATTTAVINQAVSAFVASLVGSGAISANPVLGPSYFFNASSNSSFLATCNCSIAVSISINGDAYAIAIPGLSFWPDGTVSTGNAGAISISGNGDASSSAISGSAGGPRGPLSADSSAAGEVLIDGVAVSMQDLSDLIRQLIMQLLTANGSAATGMSTLPSGALAQLASGSTVSVQIAMSGGSTWTASAPAAPASVGPAPVLTLPPLTPTPLGGSTPAPERTPLTVPGASVGCSWSVGGVGSSGAGGFGCAIAIAISINGGAHAAVATTADNSGFGGDVLAAAPRGPPTATSAATAFPSCPSTSAGSATAISIAFNGVAYALARTGNAGPVVCGPTTAFAVPTTIDGRADSDLPVVESAPPIISSVSAAAGSTGTALAVALTVRGPATSSALSGDSGVVTVVLLGSGVSSQSTSSVSTPADVHARSGATGDVLSIAMATLGATATARSGNSGAATATCTYCADGSPARAGEAALAVTTSGRTGSIFSLAVAGGQAAVDARTGDSGSVTASFIGDSSARGMSGGAAVRGTSGSTGDIVTIVVDPTTWIALDVRTGDSGTVISTALGGSIRVGVAGPAPTSPIVGGQRVPIAGSASLSSWGSASRPVGGSGIPLRFASGAHVVALMTDQLPVVSASHPGGWALRVPGPKYVIHRTILEASWVIVPVSGLLGVFFVALVSSTRRRRRTVNTS